MQSLIILAKAGGLDIESSLEDDLASIGKPWREGAKKKFYIGYYAYQEPDEPCLGELLVQIGVEEMDVVVTYSKVIEGLTKLIKKNKKKHAKKEIAE